MKLQRLYAADNQVSHMFRYALLAFDIALIAFIVVSSFLPRTSIIEFADAIIGLVIIVDVAARYYSSRQPLKDLLDPAGVADVIVVFSLFAPLVGPGFAFLRVFRTLRLLRSYELIRRLRKDFSFFRRNEAVILGTNNLFVFVFVMTSIVYETQRFTNPAIQNYADALYFTITTLTTTGFGDITLTGTMGRLIAVVIMIFGISLFFHLIRLLFRSPRVDYQCPDCGLNRHESDAIHCKHCGRTLHMIEQSGSTAVR